ncbi:YkvS family protein [Virgibacillus halodenitrificans]|uniref:YkvS family protein n=1 Tax=Virgibacillus halodenitrificans TaxID=1482 RepID=UPI000EF4FEC7|nr:DUF2187 family protein [Virgibacillus halodenitrificans]
MKKSTKPNPNTAKPGDFISFGEGFVGEVIKVLNNTVIADITKMEGYSFRIHGWERQVVHYSKYEVIKRAIQPENE